jgi:hypothetical protein
MNFLFSTPPLVSELPGNRNANPPRYAANTAAFRNRQRAYTPAYTLDPIGGVKDKLTPRL